MKMMLVIFKEMMLAAIFPLGRGVLAYTQPLFFTAIRMMLGGIVLTAYRFCKDGALFEPGARVTKRLWKLIALFMLAGVVGTNVCEAWALKFVPAAKASFIYSLSPFFAAIMAHLFFGEYLNFKKIIGIAIGFAGFIFMLVKDAPGELTVAQCSFVSAGEAALLIAAVTSVYGWSVMRTIVRDYRVSSIEANGIAMIVGGLLILAASLVLEGPYVALSTSWKSMLPFLILSVIASNLLGYSLYGFLLNTYSTTLLSFAGLLEPPIAAFYGYIFLAEPVGAHFFIAMTLVLLGLFIFYRQELSQGYVVTLE